MNQIKIHNINWKKGNLLREKELPIIFIYELTSKCVLLFLYETEHYNFLVVLYLPILCSALHYLFKLLIDLSTKSLFIQPFPKGKFLPTHWPQACHVACFAQWNGNSELLSSLPGLLYLRFWNEEDMALILNNKSTCYNKKGIFVIKPLKFGILGIT